MFRSFYRISTKHIFSGKTSYQKYLETVYTEVRNELDFILTFGKKITTSDMLQTSWLHIRDFLFAREDGTASNSVIPIYLM